MDSLSLVEEAIGALRKDLEASRCRERKLVEEAAQWKARCEEAFANNSNNNSDFSRGGHKRLAGGAELSWSRSGAKSLREHLREQESSLQVFKRKVNRANMDVVDAVHTSVGAFSQPCGHCCSNAAKESRNRLSGVDAHEHDDPRTHKCLIEESFTRPRPILQTIGADQEEEEQLTFLSSSSGSMCSVEDDQEREAQHFGQGHGIPGEFPRDSDADAGASAKPGMCHTGTGTELKAVLIVAKRGQAVHSALVEVASSLARRGLDVYVEPSVYEDENTHTLLTKAMPSNGRVLTWETAVAAGDKSEIRTRVSSFAGGVPLPIIKTLGFIVTLGGDGTVLWASRLLGNQPTPPVVSFALGSLGFMTPFPMDDFDATLDSMKAGQAKLMYRHRLQAFVFRGCDPFDHSTMSRLESHWQYDECYHVLNEITVDRGTSSFVTSMDVFCDETHVTNVQGDGVIIATPSGSTAYSLAAGGSICHPEIPAMLVTPICPHSLSFRPIIFPHHSKLVLQVPEHARTGVTCSFDGKDSITMGAGDILVICMSAWPLRAVCR